MRNRHHRRTLFAAGAAFLAAAIGTAAIGIQSASAPQPADTKAPLANSTGATAAAVYSDTKLPTTVVVWPGSFQPGNVAAGTPCSTYGLPAGSRTSKVIEAKGPLRRCN